MNERSSIRYAWLCLGMMLVIFVPRMSGAFERFQVVALFNNRVMVEVDGERHFLKVGETSPEGIGLISSTTEEAVLLIDGRREAHGLGSVVGGTYVEREETEVRIWRDVNGAFNTVGSINGRTTNMMVDTGATSVAISEVEAKRLGIPYRLEGRRIMVNTASGSARAYGVNFDRIKVGDIELHNVEGIVLEGASPRQVLLGMSFLRRVEMENRDEVLLLRSKF
jgi:aspartyl protease family protein